MGARQLDDAVSAVPPPRRHRRRGQGPQLADPRLGHRRAARSEEIKRELEERRDIDPQARAAGGELRGVVPRADGPDPLRALHQALHRKAVGPAGAHAVRAVGTAPRVGALGQRSVSVPRPVSGLARRAERIHRPHRRAAARRTGIDAAHRRRRDARQPRRAPERQDRPDAVVLTCPLDQFAGERFGTARLARHRSCARCTSRTSITRRARWSSTTRARVPVHPHPRDQARVRPAVSRARCSASSSPNAPTRYYPIELPENRALNDRYQDHIRDHRDPRAPVYFAGRLANYLYIDMDDCMRQALNTADEVIAGLS